MPIHIHLITGQDKIMFQWSFIFESSTSGCYQSLYILLSHPICDSDPTCLCFLWYNITHLFHVNLCQNPTPNFLEYCFTLQRTLFQFHSFYPNITQVGQYCFSFHLSKPVYFCVHYIKSLYYLPVVSHNIQLTHGRKVICQVCEVMRMLSCLMLAIYCYFECGWYRSGVMFVVLQLIPNYKEQLFS